MIRLGLLILLNLAFTTSYTQELKKKKKFSDGYQEEFTVLKNNKKIKHGQYIKFRINSFGNKGINTVGFFNNNEKTGEWLYLSHGGYLQKEGKYTNDKKSGLWTEYYVPTPNSINTLDVINSAFEVNKGITVTENSELIIDRNGLTKSSEGVYYDNQKIGAWNYYATDGSLIHKFDHDSLIILQDLTKGDSLDFPFLGGRTRFLRSFGSLERYDGNSYFKTFKISIIRENTNVNYKANHPVTDKTLRQIISKLRELEAEFIWHENDSLLFTLELIPNGGGMFGRFETDFIYTNTNK